MDFIIIIIALLEIILGIVVYLRGGKTKSNTAFIWITFSLAAWCVAIYMLWHSLSRNLLFWDNATYLGSSILPAVFLYFAINFSEERKISKILHFLIIIPVPIIWLSAFTNLITPSIENPLQKTHGIGYYFFAIYFLLCMALGFVLLYYKLKAAKGIEKLRLQYVFWGAILSTICGTFFNLILPTFGNWNFIKIGPPISGLILVTSFSFAILKYKLFDIEVIVKKTLVFAGMFAFSFGVVVAIALITQDLLPQYLAISRRVSLAISILIIIFSLHPLENFLINITNKYLFQKKYNPRKILKDFADEALTILNLDKLCKVTVDTLVKNLYLSNCAVLLLTREEIGYEIYDSFGIDSKNIYFDTNTSLVKYLMSKKLPSLSLSYDKILQAQNDVKKDMEKIQSQACLPLIIRDDLVGILSLGSKKSDQPYTQDDIDILTTLAKALSIAISNAKLFMEAAQNEKLAAIGTITSAINHEICTPLSRMSMPMQIYIENKRRELPSTEPDEAEEIMQNALQEIKRVTDITSKLSSFAKPSRIVESKPINISQNIGDVLSLMEQKLKLTRIKINKNITDNLAQIIADENQMRQIFFNLIKNATEAIKEDGVITITVKEDEDKVKIEIQDTGCGIPEDKLNKIFEPFYSTKGNKGSGYGLAIVKELVQRNNGEISVKTNPGQGTTFTLEFPKA